MRHTKPVSRPIASLFPIFLAAFLASGSAFGLQYVVVQPIDVCSTTGAAGGSGCAPFNNLTQTPNPANATSTTPIGWVDTSTNINITRAIWLKAGIDVTFLPMVQYNNTNYQSIEVDCSTVTNPCSGTLTSSGNNSTIFALKDLWNGTTSTATRASGCISNCTVPVGANSPFPNANAIYMFFVNNLKAGTGVGSPLYGFGWINGNGLAVSKNTFFPIVPQTPHTDTLAHEIGHNLGLDHNTFGAPQPMQGTTGTPCVGVPPGVLPTPGGCNLMDSGSTRISPAKADCTPQSTSPSPPPNNGGALYDLNSGLTGPCLTNNPGYPIADYLIPGTGFQQVQVGKSGFLNSVANVSATAGGGGDAAVNGAAATASTTCVPTGKEQCFTVTYPSDGTGRVGGFIAALILAAPEGYKFGGNSFTYVSGVKPKSAYQLNGNGGGGNSNCQKSVPVSGLPGLQCLEIDFTVTKLTSPPSTCPADPQTCYMGTFHAGTSITFKANIINTTTGQPAMLRDLQCDTPMTLSCLTITPVFGDLFAATFDFSTSGGNPVDTTVASQIINPANFPTIQKLNPPLTFTGTSTNPVTGGVTPCDPSTVDSDSGACPPLASGDPNEGG
jgi:hypothetical protein